MIKIIVEFDCICDEIKWFVIMWLMVFVGVVVVLILGVDIVVDVGLLIKFLFEISKCFGFDYD